jgi:DNA-binding MarR family transcriptional regulator
LLWIDAASGGAKPYNGVAESKGKPAMTHGEQKRIALTGPQADCLTILRNRSCTIPKLAIEAKIAINKARAALRKLAELGLAQQNEAKLWTATARGRICRFETISDQPIPIGRSPGPGAQRLLALLDRPTHGRDIARKLGITHQRVRELIIKLHAQGLVTFGDPESPSWLVRRADDKSPILSRDEERVLSALPREHATDVRKLRVTAKLSKEEIEAIVEKLNAAGLAQAVEGLHRAPAFRVTAAGLEHHQYVCSGRRAPPSRLPIQSDRVRRVLQAISEASAVRIRDLSDLTQIPRQPINALMQYLKGKDLVAKAGLEFGAPYALTDQGRAVLAEMTLRQAA